MTATVAHILPRPAAVDARPADLFARTFGEEGARASRAAMKLAVSMWWEDSSEAQLPEHLDPDHRRVLRARGLLRGTVTAAGMYSVDDDRIIDLLNARPFDGPALVIPFYDRAGRPADYHLLRPSRPRMNVKNRPIKYEAPLGIRVRAYVPPLPAVHVALSRPTDRLFIVESPIKALAMAQAGLPAIGIGPWTWQVAKSEPRRLIPDLADISWAYRPVHIVPDHDSTRNPGVEHGYAELARLLGAQAQILRLPAVEFGYARRKVAPDDFLARNGPDALREWVERSITAPREGSVQEARDAIRQARQDARRGRVYLDTSPPGTGKSFADAPSLAAPTNPDGNMTRSLTIERNHTRCTDVVREFRSTGLDAVAYPRMTADNCENVEEAGAVRDRGFPVVHTLCETCPYRDGCRYHEELAAARAAQHSVATHERGRLALPIMVGGRNRIIVHEDAVNALRPTWSAGTGFREAALLAEFAANRARDPGVRSFLRGVNAIARALDAWLHDPMQRRTVEVLPLPGPLAWHFAPKGAHELLYAQGVETGAFPPAEATQLVMCVALGLLDAVYLAVEEVRGKGGTIQLRRSLVGVGIMAMPGDATVILNDATATHDDVAGALGERAVTNITPPFALPLRHPVLQIIPARDVTKKRQPARVLAILRGLLYDIPHRRVGLITHKHLAEQLPALLTEAERGRLTRVAYFHGTESRGSNAWIGECDALVVLGTPRVPTEMIRRHLLRVGKRQAALLTADEARWESFAWSGSTGHARRTVRTRQYADHDWHQAYLSLVRAELRQAAGRGRGILPEGIPVFVVGTEDAGYPLAPDHLYGPLTSGQAEVLLALSAGQATPTNEIARRVGRSPREVRETLADLSRMGRVRRVGERGGWTRMDNRPLFSA